MMHEKKRALVTYALPLLGLLSSGVNGSGFRLPDQDAFAAARGEAFVATADNPSAIYYNPAGITQAEGQNLRTGLWGISTRTTYDPPQGGRFENQRKRHAVPNFFYTINRNGSDFGFGLGVFAPFGLSTKWPDDTGFRTIATQGSLDYYTINPVVAWKASAALSLGAGLTFNHADLDLQRGLIWPAQPHDKFQFTGDGWDVGYNLGVLWRPYEKVSLGVSYRSETTIDLEGNTRYQNSVAIPPTPPLFPGFPSFPPQDVDAETTFPYPSHLIMGISFRPTPEWNLEFNADYANWSRLDQVTVKQESGFPPLTPQDLTLALDWRDSWYYELGVTRYLAGGWSLSAGYIYNENSVTDNYYSPLIADLDRHFLTLGTGYRGKQFSFDVAYQYGHGPTRTVSGSATSPTGQSADGDYEFDSHALAASVGWRF